MATKVVWLTSAATGWTEISRLETGSCCRATRARSCHLSLLLTGSQQGRHWKTPLTVTKPCTLTAVKSWSNLQMCRPVLRSLAQHLGPGSQFCASLPLSVLPSPLRYIKKGTVAARTHALRRLRPQSTAPSREDRTEGIDGIIVLQAFLALAARTLLYQVSLRLPSSHAEG